MNYSISQIEDTSWLFIVGVLSDILSGHKLHFHHHPHDEDNACGRNSFCVAGSVLRAFFTHAIPFNSDRNPLRRSLCAHFISEELSLCKSVVVLFKFLESDFLVVNNK